MHNLCTRADASRAIYAGAKYRRGGKNFDPHLPVLPMHPHAPALHHTKCLPFKKIYFYRALEIELKVINIHILYIYISP